MRREEDDKSCSNEAKANGKKRKWILKEIKMRERERENTKVFLQRRNLEEGIML